MKVVGIVGFKKSGKTLLGMRLSQELSRMGYKVGIIKHASGDIDFPDTDTSKLRTYAPFVSVISAKETEIIVQGKKRIEDILTYYDCDIVLIEGFKKEKTFPKIVCIKNKDDGTELFDGLQLFTASIDQELADFTIGNDDHIKEMAALVLERSFKLPSLNCGHCGFESCYDLAREIVSGKKNINACVSLNPPISVMVDGTPFPLNPFVSSLFKSMVLAMLSPLKGFKKGTIEIKVP